MDRSLYAKPDQIIGINSALPAWGLAKLYPLSLDQMDTAMPSEPACLMETWTSRLLS
jgi:hypothetical protein